MSVSKFRESKVIVIRGGGKSANDVCQNKKKPSLLPDYGLETEQERLFCYCGYINVV